MILLVRAPESRFGVLRDEYRIRVRLRAWNAVGARRKALEMAWQRKLLVSRFVAWEAKKTQ
jgi:hypothetical protein